MAGTEGRKKERKEIKLTYFQRNPGTFITVLSGWSVFLSPMTGIVVADYFLVRRGEYHIGDLYMGNSGSAYWYVAGFNFRGFVAWVLGMTPLLREFLHFRKGYPRICHQKNDANTICT